MRGNFHAPVTMRSRLMLEVVSELVGDPSWRDRQVEIHARAQGASDWNLCFFASDAPNSVDAVMSGKANFAICNPGAVLSMAVRGGGPFLEPLPLRAIMALPQFDVLGVAVAERNGLTSIAQIVEQRYPLRVSMRTQPDHSAHLVGTQLLAAYGFSFDDLQKWGGGLFYHEGAWNSTARFDAVERGEIDAIIDEGFPNYAPPALQLGMRFLPIDEPRREKLEQIGLRCVTVPVSEYPGLPEGLVAVDFSGWPVFCLESTPDALVTHFCAAIEARKDRVPWYGSGPLDLKLMVSNTREAPMAIPLHPAAERFWRQQGYLP